MVTNLSEVPEVVSYPHGRHSGLSQRHSMSQEFPVHIISPSVSSEPSHNERSDSPQFQPEFQPQPRLQPPQQPQQPTPLAINYLPSQTLAEPQMPMTPIAMAPSGSFILIRNQDVHLHNLLRQNDNNHKSSLCQTVILQAGLLRVLPNMNI